MLPAILVLAFTAVQEPPAPAPTPQPPDTEAARPAPAATGASADTEIQAGLKAFGRHRLQAARAAFERAVAADPQSAAAHYYLGYALYKIAEPTRRLTADKKAAAEQFSKAFEIDPAFAPAWGSRGK